MFDRRLVLGLRPAQIDMFLLFGRNGQFFRQIVDRAAACGMPRLILAIERNQLTSYQEREESPKTRLVSIVLTALTSERSRSEKRREMPKSERTPSYVCSTS